MDAAVGKDLISALITTLLGRSFLHCSSIAPTTSIASDLSSVDNSRRFISVFKASTLSTNSLFIFTTLLELSVELLFTRELLP
ncbi:hypothetical protein QWZ13_11795 [Reinekea marina]|uniref:hypothetical protein n=1 Tax=Reinekea marina TaxID=1310421 RepID=UPI0025B2B688|nr:hypothetical protein [Reinekea marina]MDN3649599.1 hypothetical protein [Reinekea marina]